LGYWPGAGEAPDAGAHAAATAVPRWSVAPAAAAAALILLLRSAVLNPGLLA